MMTLLHVTKSMKKKYDTHFTRGQIQAMQKKQDSKNKVKLAKKKPNN